MKNILFALLAFSVLCLSSCRNDEITPKTNTDIPGPTKIVKSNVSGIVYDHQSKPVPQVIVQLGTAMVETDENGYFKLVDALVEDQGGLLKFNKDGFFESFKFVRPKLNETAHIQVALVNRVLTDNFSSTAGKTMNLNGGAQVSIPSDGIVTESGAVYNGQVNVYAHWFDPAAEDLNLVMPGDLRGTDLSDELVQLVTFGMMAVELESSTGEALQLKPGTKATLNFPLSNDLVAAAENTIPLWHLDETTGVWIEEGAAILENNAFVAEVAHFSFWNCDYPYPLINLTGVLVDPSGVALQQYVVDIVLVNGAQSGGGYTNDQGRFEGKVPANEDLKLYVKNICNGLYQEIHQQDINASSVDIDLGTITIDPGVDNVEFKGNLECMMQAITNGYVLVSFGTNSAIIDIDAQGNFSSILNPCGVTSATVVAYDLTNNNTSLPLNVVIDMAVEDLGTIETCNMLDEYIIVSKDGQQAIIFQDVDALTLDGVSTMIYTDITTDEGFELDIPLVTTGTSGANHFLLKGIGNQGNIKTAKCFTSIDPAKECNDLTVVITRYDGVGGYVEGNLSGTVEAVSELWAVTASFRIKIGSDVTTRKVSGTIWIDADNDGLRSVGEQKVPDLNLSVQGATHGRGQFGAQSDQNGEYEITGFLPEAVAIAYLSGNVTLANVGSDDTIDSDFVSNAVGWSLASVDLTQGVDATNVDLGITLGATLACNIVIDGCGLTANGFIYATGGSAPYTFNLNNGATSAGGAFTGFSPGNYSYTVTDANGDNCVDNFIIEDNLNNVSGRLWVDELGGQDNLYDSGIDTPLAGVTLKMLGMPWQTSDANGLYVFNEVISNAAENVLEVEPPVGYELLVPNVGGDDSIDSDFGENQVNAVHLLFDDCNKQFVMDAGFKQL